MAITQFLEELRKSTVEHVATKREERAEALKKRNEELSQVLDHLYDVIVADLETHMMNASKEGHYFTSVYEFTVNDIFENNRTVFLLKGPKRQYNRYSGLQFFENRNIDSVMKRLNETYNPVVFYFMYDKTSRVHKVIANWSTLIETST